MTNATLERKLNAKNPHVRFDEGNVATKKPRRGSLLRKSLGLAVVVALSASSLFSATSYVIPWYVNPGTKVKLYTGADAAFDTVDLRFGEKGDRLFTLLNTANGAQAFAYDMDKIGALTGVQTNWHNGVASYQTAFPASERVVVSSARNAYVAVNPSDGTGFEAPAGHAQWIGRFAPTTLSFGAGAIAATSFAFDATGNVLWSNSTSAGETGKLVKWTCANGAFSSTMSHDAGLAAVEAIAVYTVDGTEYVVAAAQGTVKFVNVASGAVKFTVSDADHLGAAVKAVRMSHCDYFRPRLYVLLANGDIAAYYLNRELTKATWSKTNSNAKLLAAAGAPYGADDATIVAFDVTPDGGTAAVGFAKNAGSEATVAGPTYVTLLKHEPRKWILYEANDDRNPFKGQFAVMSDGEWYLKFHWSGNGEIWVGASGTSWAQRAWTGNEFPEYLDFSHGYSYKAVDNERHSINGNEQYGFATNSLGKGPRVIVHSPTMTFFNDKCKGWSGEGNFEEVVIDCPNLNWGASWSGPDKQSQRIVYNFASMPTGYATMIYPNNNNYFGGESDWNEVTLTRMTKVLNRCFSHFEAKGTLVMPAVQVVSNEAFWVCRKMEEAKLGETSKSLQQLWNGAFKGCSALKRVTLGGASGFTFKAANVFESCPLEEVTFTGTVPSFANEAVSWPDTAEKTMTFAVPRGAADWEAILSDASKVKSRLSLAEQQAYRLANPGKYVPVGVLDKSVLKTKYDQYIAYNDMKGGATLTIERDTFFDDEVEITSDWAPAADGTYLPGTQVTLTAKPNATGSFVQWYGDVSRADEKNAQVTVTIDGDMWLYCRIVHPWTLSSDKKLLTNGNFTLNCGVQNEGAKTIYVGQWAKYGLFATDDIGVGVIDLGGPVTVEGTSERWTISKTADSGGVMVGKRGGKGSGVTTLIFPSTLTTTPGGQWMHATTGDPFGISYKTLIMDEPNITGNPFPGWSTCGHYDLAHFILRIPRVTAITGDPSFWNISAEKTKFEWWDVSSVNNIAYRAFCGYDWNNRLLCTGKLTLPSYRAIVKNSLSVLRNVEEISLGGLTKTTTVTSIDVNAFDADAKLRRLTIHNDESLTVANANVFKANQVPGEIVLTGKVPTNDIFANLLGNATAAAAKPVKVYVSANMGWANRPSYLDAPTEAERAEAPGETVLGVYRGGATAPSGKALVIHRTGPFDPRGTYLIVR